MSARKEKFEGVMTHWEKEELKKELMRQNLMGTRPQLKPRVQLLQIGDAMERQEAIKRGCMVFRDGQQVIELPLIDPMQKQYGEVGALQGVYKIPNEGYVVARTKQKNRYGPDEIRLYGLHKLKTTIPVANGPNVPVELWQEKSLGGIRGPTSFFFRVEDLAHMMIGDIHYSGYGLSLKIASKTEREQRARTGGGHSFVGLTKFEGIFKRLGYRTLETDERSPWVNPLLGFKDPWIPEFRRFEKTGKLQPFDDMNQYHRIEAIDPKTGKPRIFTFSINEPREIRPGREIRRRQNH